MFFFSTKEIHLLKTSAPNFFFFSCDPFPYHACVIKVENMMLDGAGHLKLIDYGLSQELKAGASVAGEPMSPTGSLIYMPPELLRDKIGGRFTDWLSTLLSALIFASLLFSCFFFFSDRASPSVHQFSLSLKSNV